jgi:NAD(P)-dependent dehydrogenase (short-subunit alcohol dehydrogenase family)
MQLDGKVALITGGGSGIGKATAELFALEGCRVAVVDIEQEEIDSVVNEIQAGGGETVGIRADVSQPDDLEDAVRRIVSRWGRLDIVFANAGINGLWAPLEEITPAQFNIRVNVICPGAVETNIGENTEMRDLEEVRTPVEFPEGMMPLTHGKSGCPEQVARLVLFLASDASDLITGTEIWIDGGESLLQG